MSKRKWFLAALSVLAVSLTPARGLAQEAVTWGYEGEGGPASWGDLDDDYAACSEGASQSPIDLESIDTTARYGGTVLFQYGDSGLTILNNGYTVEVEYDAGSSIVAAGRTYNLTRFHFHSPSEHTFERGAHFAMEMHLVHRSVSGTLAVVAVLIREGEQNPALTAVWEHLPLEVGEEDVHGVEIEIDDALPRDRRAYHYMGSLTTPPCSEGVHWFVLREPIEMSAEQIAQFRDAISGSCCGSNNRPTQNRNKRGVGLDRY